MELYDNYWSKIQNAVGLENMEDFLTDYLVFARRSNSFQIDNKQVPLSKNKLYDIFKFYYSTLPGDNLFEKTRILFEKLLQAAKLYQSMTLDDDQSLASLSPSEKIIYFMLNVFQAHGCKSLLLYLYSICHQGLISEAELTESLKVILTRITRFKVCKTGQLSYQSAGNIMTQLHHYFESPPPNTSFIDALWDSITLDRGSYAFPQNETFRDALMSDDIYTTLRSIELKYILYYLEMNQQYSKDIPPWETTDLNVEHIMPKKLTDHWIESLGEDGAAKHSEYLNRLGNLALTTYNSEMSNKSFQEKKKFYDNARFHLTRELAENDSWKIKDIIKRGENLADMALKVWPSPEKYQWANKPAVNLDDNDFTFATAHDRLDEFTNYQPYQVRFNDHHKKAIGSWAHLLRRIILFLAETDVDIIEELSEMYPHRLSPREKANASYAKYIDLPGTHVQLNTHGGTLHILNNLYKIISAFDKKSGSDYLNTIIFSVKLNK